MALWHRGIVAPWYYGIVALWHCGLLALWHRGIVATWHCGIVASWHCGILALWHFGIVAVWHLLNILRMAFFLGMHLRLAHQILTTMPLMFALATLTKLGRANAQLGC